MRLQLRLKLDVGGLLEPDTNHEEGRAMAAPKAS
jgi:hypothetical protein